MRDISKCEGTDCKKKETCIRFTQPAKAKNQAFMLMKVAIPDTDKCRFYWPEEDTNA